MQSSVIAEPPPQGDAVRQRPRIGRVTLERYLLIIIWLLMLAVFVALEPDRFLQINTLQSMFRSADIYVFLGLAALPTLIVREFDLSIPFTMGISATIVPVLYTQHDTSIVVAVVVALLAALTCGAINAVIVVRFGVDALVATLGTGTIILGIAQAVSHETPTAGLTQGFSKIASAQVFGMSSTFWAGLTVAGAMAYLISSTPLGRRMTFVGANREVSRLAGIRVDRVRFGAYCWGSLLAGVSGVLLAARLGGFDASAANGYLLPTFATAFVSASVIRPGRFNPFGVVIGAYFIASGALGLQILGFSGWTQHVFYGVSLVGAVTVVSLVRRRSR